MINRMQRNNNADLFQNRLIMNPTAVLSRGWLASLVELSLLDSNY